MAVTSAPQASIILPTYKRQEVLPRAIRSVLAQTTGDWELIVVDDEPSAETRRLVAAFSDDRIEYIAHDRNRGLSAARNTGIRRASGSYIAFLDDDDEFLERKLEAQVGVLEKAPEEVGVVTCFEEVRKAGGSVVSRDVRLEGDVQKTLARNDLVRMQLLLVRGICFDRVGLFDERLRHHEDFDMTFRLARSFRFATVAERLIRIHKTQGSLSDNLENRIRAIEIMMATHPELRRRGAARARWERRLARHHAELGDGREWCRHLWRSLRANPLGAASWITLGVGTLVGPGAHVRLGRLRGRLGRYVRGSVG